MDLDSILDQALDDFEEQELQEKTAAASSSTSHQRDGEIDANDLEAERIQGQAQLASFLQSLQDPSYGKTLQNTLKSLSSTSEGVKTVDSLFEDLSRQFESDGKPSYYPDNENDKVGIEKADREVAATLQMVGRAHKGMEGFEAGKMEEVGETMMEEMMAEFESLGEKEDYNEVVDGVMRQLLSKDLMYEPTQQICDKFPEWLAIHRKNLSETEYLNYGRQYQTFQKILAVYDTEPDNFPRLMELMFDMQQYGQPPAEIIKDLAPGLQFDENGMPIMPNMGAGMMPEMGMPGGEGLPNMAEMAGNMANGQCCIS
mmetsp:Transcript_12481/g.17126  ORF Transcript_12481/g.17126 Transcript_12481/m.17126 type:complete len:314 (+) Transcript_12481:2-943(+)